MDYRDDPYFAEETTALEGVYGELERKEGKSGDTTGARETGLIGVTQTARDAVGGSDDKETARLYLEHLNTKLSEGIPRYTKAPLGVQKALLDTAYNAGPQILNWEGMKSAMTTGDWQGALLQILDTANVGGKTVKGLAKRRAEAYNMAAENKISKVKQDDDGTLSYIGDDGNIIFSYKKSKHPKSKAGIINI